MKSDYSQYGVVVHPRIVREHGIAGRDVLAAWRSSLPLKRRDVPRNGQGSDEYVTIGFDTSGRTVELVAAPYDEEEVWLIYHGRRPASKGFVSEYRRIGGER